MFKIIETAINYLFISHHNDPIRQYCQTEFKENWKAKYYELTGKTIHQTPSVILDYARIHLWGYSYTFLYLPIYAVYFLNKLPVYNISIIVVTTINPQRAMRVISPWYYLECGESRSVGSWSFLWKRHTDIYNITKLDKVRQMEYNIKHDTRYI